jgi:hypothetical protein
MDMAIFQRARTEGALKWVHWTKEAKMADKLASENVYNAVFQLCFFVLFFETLAFAEWIFISTITWQSPIRGLVPYFAGLLVVEIIALVLYFRMPWVMLIVAWTGVVLILMRGIPWNTPQWSSSLRRFQFEIFLLVFAHAGYAAYVLRNRAAAADEAEAASEPPLAGANGGQP